jgi:carboxyl-terminal processing protease
MDANGNDLKAKYDKDIDRFDKEFVVTDEILKPFFETIKSKGIEFNQEQYNKDEKIIKTLIKAYIARNIWGNEGWYKTRLTIDSQVQKALTLFPEAEKIAKITKK